MLLILSFALSLALPTSFRAHLTVEEQGQKASYVVYLKKGALRVDPESEEGTYLLIDVEKKIFTIVETKQQVYCRADVEGVRSLVKADEIRETWFPWVYQASPDLLEQLEINERGPVPLPNGTKGIKTEVYSETYDRVVAEYWVDPTIPAHLFFQWGKIDFDLWSEKGERVDAQRKRIEIYDQLKGLPWRMEERFRLLTQPRVLSIEKWEPASEDSWSVPEGYAEKSVAQLIWENLLRRLERWLRPKNLSGDSRSWTSRIR